MCHWQKIALHLLLHLLLQVKRKREAFLSLPQREVMHLNRNRKHFELKLANPNSPL